MEDLKKLTVNFSLFATSSNFSPASKSPRSFVNGGSGTVGLGIVAAMQDSEALQKSTISAAAAILSVNFPKTNSNSKAIPISGGSAYAAAKSESQRELMELSESYTCVISHIGDESVKKQEYYNDDQITVTTGNVFRRAEKIGKGVFSDCSPYLGEVQQGVGSFWSSDFLSSCSLCCKKLQGLDIFMYRGEKAFCSAECRAKHIASDNHKEKCRKGAMRSIDQSPSSCSCQTTAYFAGVAAA